MTTKRKSLVLLLVGGVAFVASGILGAGYIAIAGWCLAAAGALWYSYDWLTEGRNGRSSQ
jgi:hypothetical protein